MPCEPTDVDPLPQAPQRAGRGEIDPSLVLRELQHRMGNILAILHANLRMEFAGIEDRNLRESFHRLEKHILSVAELHLFLARSAGHGEIVAAEYFRPLCAVLSRSVLAPRGLHCEAFIGEGCLPVEKSERLALIVAELVINAGKHAFPGRRVGHVRVEIAAHDLERWCCTVSDNGCGLANGERGTGSQLVDGLVRFIDGQIAMCTGPAGTTVTILFPK